MIVQIQSYGIFATGVVYILQALLADGDELALVVGGAGRFGVPFHCARPEYMLFALSHSVDVRLQFFVGIDGNFLCIVLVTFHLGVAKQTAPLGIFSRAE